RFAALVGQPAPPDSAGTGEDVPTADAGHSPDPRSVAVGTNTGIISTGDGATIGARTLPLPPGAVRAPAEVPAPQGLHNLAPRNLVFVDRDETLAELDTVISQES